MHETKVTDIIDETHDTKSIRFERPENFEYKAGQYCIFEKQMGADLIRRSYSLSSSPTEDFLQITVKHMPKGVMSTYFNTELKVGDVLKFNGPVGHFVFEDEMKDVVFIAGGSGISPFRGMLKYIEDKKLKTNATLIYGSRSPEDIILREELERFNKDENIHLFLTVDHPSKEWKFHVGYINVDFIKEATSNNLNKIYFLIGPGMMITKVKEALLEEKVPEEQIHLDAW